MLLRETFAEVQNLLQTNTLSDNFQLLLTKFPVSAKEMVSVLGSGYILYVSPKCNLNRSQSSRTEKLKLASFFLSSIMVRVVHWLMYP